MKYKVVFEFKIMDTSISDGQYHEDYLDNNGEGFTFEEAENVAIHLRMDDVAYYRYVEVVEM
jgi:hypothetical protein